MTAAIQARGNPADKRFLGHPRGLAYLAFTEAWERFSFYGMQALLLLYMIQHLLTPDIMGSVFGLGQFRSMVEAVPASRDEVRSNATSSPFLSMPMRWHRASASSR